MKKKLANFYLHPDTLAELKRVADKRHVSMATIVQIALDEYIQRFKADEEIPEGQAASSK